MTLCSVDSAEKCPSFDSLLAMSFSKDTKEISKFAPRSQRNTCCKHNHHGPAPVFATGVPSRARCKFWYLFGKRPHQKRIKWWHFSAESTMWSAMLYWKFSTNDDTSNSNFPGSDCVNHTSHTTTFNNMVTHGRWSHRIKGTCTFPFSCPLFVCLLWHVCVLRVYFFVLMSVLVTWS